MPPFWQGLNSLNLVDRQDEIAFRNLQPRLEPACIREVVDVDVRRPRHRLHRLGLVVQVVPADWVVQSANHIDAVG